MNTRTWHYILPPQAFDCTCEKCGGRNLEWSEFESHIWCCDCEIDFDPGEGEHAGIFSGPIPLQITALFGTSFDRYLIQEKKIQRFNIETHEWEDNWFSPSWDSVAKNLLLDNIKNMDDRYGDVTFFHGLENFEYPAGKYYRMVLYEVLNRFKDEHRSKS
jgi:hypothetical protein